MPDHMYEITPMISVGVEGRPKEIPAASAEAAARDWAEQFVTEPSAGKQPLVVRVVDTITEAIFYYRVDALQRVEHEIVYVSADNFTEQLATIRAQQLMADMAVGKALLCRYFELADDRPFDFQYISDRLYAETECGAWLEERPDGIALGCIIEGSEAICQTHELTWTEVSKERLDEVVAAIEEEADVLFKEAHGQTEPWNNMARALSVSPSIELFCESMGMQEEPHEDVLTDFVANLQHYCREHSICFATILRKADDHFTEELHVEGQQKSPMPSYALAQEVAVRLQSVNVDLRGYVCVLSFINKLLQGQNEELNAPLDDAETRFMQLLREKFEPTHQLWQHISVIPEVE